MSKNPKKGLSFDQTKIKSLKEEKSFNLYPLKFFGVRPRDLNIKYES